MEVAVYHKTVPSKKNQEKVNVLRYFSQGARLKDSVTDVNLSNVVLSDVAVIQGWVTDTSTTTNHGKLRQEVIAAQQAHKKYTVAIDSNLFLYATPGNPDHYLRYSFNDVFPNTGIYCDRNVDPARWKKLSQKIGIRVKDYRSNGSHILLCLQRNGGWSMGNFNVVAWAQAVITNLRQYTNRNIIVRPHPGDKKAAEYSKIFNRMTEMRVYLSQNGKTLTDDLTDCWAAVGHNSSPTVAAAIEGIPVFVTDPLRSQSAEIANTDWATIEKPVLPDRQKWLERLAMFHWNFEELASGECWAHMREFVK
jgi:hypothetical protein